jgi:tetratricopeptide (TPR) repeat protein
MMKAFEFHIANVQPSQARGESRGNARPHSVGVIGLLLLGIAAVALAIIPTSIHAQAQSRSTPSREEQIQGHFQQAAADLRANNPKAAIEEYNAIVALDPKNAEALANRGALNFLRGDCKSAEPDFRAALASDTSLAKATAMLALCENRMAEQSAQTDLESAFAELKEKHLREQVGTALVSLYFQQGDEEHAASVAQSLVAMDPDNADILYMAQLVYSELADDTLNKLTVVAPGSARMQQVIAEHLVNAGNLKEAIEYYKKCLELDPGLAGVRFELAEAILESAKTDPATQAQAQAVLEEAAHVEGDSAKIEAELGRIAMLASDSSAAEERYRRALEIDPGEVVAQIGIGHVLMSFGKNEEAMKYLREAVAADPLNSEAHYRLGTVYRKLHMDADAEKELKLFQEIKKTDDQVREIYRQMNKRPKFEEEDQPPDSSEQ